MNSNTPRAAVLVAFLSAGCGAASDDYEPAAPPPPPPAAPATEPTPLPEPYTAEASSAAPPSGAQSPASTPPPPPNGSAAPPPPPSGPPQAPASDQLVYSYPTGQWVYMSGQGWVWIPAGSESTEMEGVPYTYLYTPAYGWTWYVSPWGWGPYHYGVWARHPWHPVGLHGYWVARPHAVVRLGPRRFHR